MAVQYHWGFMIIRNKQFNFKVALLPILYVLILNVSEINAQEKIIINRSVPFDTSIEFMQGFLHGNPLQSDSVAVAALKPAFWRIGAYALAGSGYEDAVRFNPLITININDYYMIANNITSQTQSQPWVNNWTQWDAMVTLLATNSVTNNAAVTYWDAWGEPDNFWTGSYNQWIEMYRRTDSILNSILPSPKLIGPEFGFGSCNFQSAPIMMFLDSLHAAGGSVEGISWHEFCDPESVPVHVQEIRDSLAVRPWASGIDILIPEYAGPANSTIPGWNAGWLYYFEQSKVNWVSHGCWDENDGLVMWSNCHHGLNGLFMYDNETPQPNYWVHRAYAEIGTERITTQPLQPRTVALCGYDSTTQEMKIIAGRYYNSNLGSHNAPANVELKILNSPYSTNASLPIIIQRIPSNNVAHSVPCLSPQTVFNGTVTFTGDSASIILNGFIDGDVYIVYINPAAGSVLGTQPETVYPASNISIHPNPAVDAVQVNTGADNIKRLTLYDINGRVVFEREYESSEVQLDLHLFDEGVYTVVVETASAKFNSKIVIAR